MSSHSQRKNYNWATVHFVLAKMFHLLVLSVLILEAFTPCNGQDSLQVSIQMNGVNGTVNFAQVLQNLTGNVTLSESLGAGTVTVEVRPIWVNYDTADKCNDSLLGTAVPGLSQNVSFANNFGTFVFPYMDSLASLGGYSIVLIGTSKTVCASIESSQNHSTAYALFQDSVQGTVYFRQAINSSHTRIVTDLFSNKGPYNNSTWFISDSYKDCSLVNSSSQLNIYNPNSVSGTGCSKTAQDSCAVGQLSGKLGDASIGQNIMERRLGYTDKNLRSLDALNEKLLIIETAGTRVCSVIRVFAPRQAMVEFSHDGVTGSVSFVQANPFDPTMTHVNLKGLNSMAKGYHVHLWPAPVKIMGGQDLCGPTIVSGHWNPYNKTVTDPSYPAPDKSTDDMYEVGDLSSKYGTLENLQEINQMYIDLNLPLFGSKSIIGRSLVIHHNDAAASRWVCSNIWPADMTMVAIAVFKYPVIGEVIFTQTEPYSETTVFARLDYNDGRSATTGHKWAIQTHMVGNDTLTEDKTRCQSTGTTYDPHNFGAQISPSQYGSYCSRNSPLGCMLGDLSGRMGYINIRNAAGTTDTSAKQFFTDVNLPLFGQFSVVGRSVAIMVNDQEASILSCANIQNLRMPTLSALFNMEGIGLVVQFQQEAGFGVRKTSVLNTLTGLKDNHRLFIYELPPSAGSGLSSCSNLGGIFNPLNIAQNPSTPTTDDKYMIGDLSRKGTNHSWTSYNLPLTGLTSIGGRSLVVVDQSNQNKVVACAKIVSSVGLPPPSKIIEAVSTFTGAVTGTVRLFQTIYTDGTMDDTSILIELSNQNGQKSLHHNWHTHQHPIRSAEEAKCMTAGPHFDPYMTMKNQTNYASECKPENPLRCELGDQSSKLSTYDIGGGGKLYNDVDLPLYGNFSVLGRSMVFHVSEKGTGRLACADIIPVTDVFVMVNIKNGNITDRLDVAKVYATAIGTNTTNVAVQLISESADATKLNVYFVGFEAASLKTQFENILRENKDRLFPYVPYTTGAANYSQVSLMLLLTVLAMHLLKCL